MKTLIFVLTAGFILISCQNNSRQQKLAIAHNYNVYGDTITISEQTKILAANTLYKDLQHGDTVTGILTAKVIDVCKKKGCWMKLNLNEQEEVMVRFRDYAFFVPKDISGKQVILQGIAFVDQVSVEDQQHYAMDAGESEAEITAITKVKNTYTFQANGVLVKKSDGTKLHETRNH